MKFRPWTESARAGRGRVAILVLMAGVLLWLWPIGFGGKMPVGGDVTQFFLGLMAVLGTALGDWQLPIWNDLWGYGFPGIGESQMGVYYPPHLILYGFLPTEWAYVSSLLLHTFWGALGAWWAAPVRSQPDGFEPRGLRILGVRLLRHSHASSLGLYHGLLDALGLGTDVVSTWLSRAKCRSEDVSLEPGLGVANLARPLPDCISDPGGHRADGGLVRARTVDLERMGGGPNIRNGLRLQNAAGSYDLRMRSRGFSTHGASTLADGSPGSPGLGSARLRLSLWVRRHTLASG